MRYFYFFILLALLGCKNRSDKDNDITNVELVTSPCIEKCSVIGISIDSSLNCKFYGGANSEKRGYYSGKINQDTWDSLKIKLENIKYEKLRSYPEKSEEQFFVLIVHSKKYKTVRNLFGTIGMPPDLRKMLTWIVNVHKTAHLKPSAGTLKFETEIEDTLSTFIDTATFSSPKKKRKAHL